MSRTIHKYEVPFGGIVNLRLPFSARILGAGNQRETIVLWVEYDPDLPRITRSFAAFANGSQLPDEQGTYIGTVLLHDGELAAHVFEHSYGGPA